ncbi:DUF2268 domain-containing putative Zn-dependent protease [Phenylobacterium sp.]|uniref:gliding motility protein GldB-related protein n=1 Tax=Phenylobacterium sp. TaxID=1871053 RepID=UPI00273291F1|nr:DUF2268 domain-containing putative Zn-dependent protease [Phenylobacterium sp.]MDP3854985.1 DUF2268 domain-containing putative Zn-dependent protease [Phenylobacterium sp.]
MPLQPKTRGPVVVALLVLAASSPAWAAPPRRAVVLTQDVTRFYEVYDAAGGQPSAGQLDRDYLGQGSEGLRHFAQVRNVTGARIADTLGRRPEIYVAARRCLTVLPAVKRRLTTAFGKLARLYPEATLSPVTIVVGRGRPIGVADSSGVAMGLEALCAADFMHPDLEDRFVHTIAHEYGHIQQAQALKDLEPGDAGATVLRMSLMEGAAEFVGELISGAPGNHQHRAWTKGREAQIEAAFVADQDKTDLSAWLNNGPGTAEKPGDLGYWVGHRIVKAYYDRAPDKRQALADIFEMADPKAFLTASGWRPAS